MPKLLTSIIFLSLTLILILFLLFPKYQRLRDLEKEIWVVNVDIENQENYINQINENFERLKEYQVEISKIDQALPSQPDLPSLFRFLQKISAENGLTLKKLGTPAITTSKPALAEGIGPEFKEISLDFEISGLYFAFKNFLSVLERSAKLILVESISFSVEGEVLSSHLKIKTFSY